MDLIFSAIQFIETSLLFSAFLFSAIMFIRTRDGLAGRTLMVLFPVSTLLFISYMYSINVKSSEILDSNMSWLSPFFAFVIIALIMASILATCCYIIQLFPASPSNKKKGFMIAAALVGALLIITGILVMYISQKDLALAVTNALWAFYPLCSIAVFIEAVSLACAYKNITDAHDRKLARYFLISFIPQIAFSILDFILLRDISFQLTHISYAAFSLFAFIDLCAYFFRSYDTDANISWDKQKLKDKYTLSEREIEVTELLIKGMTNKEIGESLHISINTVKTHIKNIYGKLGISNRLQLINILSRPANNS
ncbi:MAG: helix-turn-helix transcriptional regulator [Burkholderiales bacterium]